MPKLIFKLTLLALSTIHSPIMFAAAQTPLEHKVQHIALAAPLDDPDIEFSGMTWCGNTLILLPQYPERFGKKNESHFYQLNRSQILSYLTTPTSEPLKATAIRVFENNIRERMTFFDGFEAIACDNETAWLSIEALNLFGTYQAYLVPAELNLDSETPNISIRTDQIRYVKSQSGLSNKGDEAIVLHGEHVISLHEINDSRYVPRPKGNRVHTLTGDQSQIEFTHLPYRVTDASSSDSQGQFWIINYKYSGDRFAKDAKDIISEEYGTGASHKRFYNIERLIEYQFQDDRIVRTHRPPIQLKMEGKEGRNWEGLARLDDKGFLLITDKHPKTILGFVSLMPELKP